MQPKQSSVVRNRKGTVLAVLLPLWLTHGILVPPRHGIYCLIVLAPFNRTTPVASHGNAESGSAQTGSNPSAEPAQTTQLNDVAGEARQDPATAEQSGQPASNSPTTQQPVSNSSNGASSPQPQNPKEPVGTAAAESISTTGVAASRPAGVAVAPAKQRRVRSILIKMGALAGVGIAIGTTMALSQGSPSKPPGSH
jgi:hypothetical protein